MIDSEYSGDWYKSKGLPRSSPFLFSVLLPERFTTRHCIAPSAPLIESLQSTVNLRSLTESSHLKV